ncbi:MAG: hypothetical protein E5Y50_33360 [Mesorhizobium sp.]|nr:MAG: hypothetical protein E5Y50_33360 [Mesorhizobium sp.]
MTKFFLHHGQKGINAALRSTFRLLFTTRPKQQSYCLTAMLRGDLLPIGLMKGFSSRNRLNASFAAEGEADLKDRPTNAAFPSIVRCIGSQPRGWHNL